MDSSQEQTLKLKFAGAFLPLIPWFKGQLIGRKYGHLVSLSLDHPTEAQVVNIWRDWREYFGADLAQLIPFLSPSYRRRWRNGIKRDQVEDLAEARKTKLGRVVNKALRIIEAWLLKGGHRLGAGRIRKFAEVEKEQLEPLQAFFANDLEVREQVKELFSPSQCVEAPLIRRKLIQECGGEDGYFSEVINLLTELTISPKLNEDTEDEKKNRPLLRALQLEREFHPKRGKQAKCKTLLKTIKTLISRLSELFGDETTRLTNLRRVIGKILVDRFVPYPYSGRGVVSLAKPIGDDLTLEDTLADHRAMEVLSDMEDRMVLDQSLELLPASQREDARFFMAADESGKSPEDLRRELGEKKYKSKQRNLQRVKKTLADFRKSGRLPT